MINSDDESDVYPLYNDSVCAGGLLDSSQMMPALSLSAAGDVDCNSIVGDSFDSTTFLSNSISDDIANYNFLEPLMSISMLDDSGNNESEQVLSSTQVEAHCSSSCRTTYTFDPVSLSVVRCVVATPGPVSTSVIGHSADFSVSAPNVDDELDTVDITRRVSEELRRCNISQALFAQAVLGRSQGTLSDLLRKPKPWSQLKSGRETFAKMQQWLMEPEQQRLASLNITGCTSCTTSCTVVGYLHYIICRHQQIQGANLAIASTLGLATGHCGMQRYHISIDFTSIDVTTFDRSTSLAKWENCNVALLGNSVGKTFYEKQLVSCLS